MHDGWSSGCGHAMSDFMIMVFDWFMLKMCNPMEAFDWLIRDTWVMMVLMWQC